MNAAALDLTALRHHGDVEAGEGLLDFAVNVRGSAPPRWLQEALTERIGDLGRYPGAAEDRRARGQVARRHRRSPEEVLLLAGGAEGFALLPRLAPRLAAVVHPSFTEPELALREAGVPVRRVVLDEPYRLDPDRIPDDADLVVVGNPTNPTSVLHPRETLLALRRPGRIVVVDEAFADAVIEERESVAGLSLPDVLVLRSLTKTWALAGLRVGYALGAPEVLARLAHGRPHWPLGTLQLAGIEACSTAEATAAARRQAELIETERAEMVAALTAIGVRVHLPAAGPFLLLRVPGGERVRTALRARGIAVRRCDTFPGLTADHLRVAVRDPEQVRELVVALNEIGCGTSHEREDH
ncbi:threonine-phosphate decarboxylase [Rhodococcus sp. D2-41]|uniref:Aminotransferase n=1 Tax=Speluncibacter jeojiensis TaxID=2710754 RepID=A0A9X4M2S5_9ACTN|nr:Rv2231c family pyridoxal phosphate-dependent protein CobC [Rhodococcus sp. D2-41]MDG3011900.1 threonine-phosphate decarboxylase [Rhodococcus sp. D2-41]MDG3013351.1 Rv2231c family pyridoxal phosphate-dependent protein CobC [Corynebacteriales bacterium D3-21]